MPGFFNPVCVEISADSEGAVLVWSFTGEFAQVMPVHLHQVTQEYLLTRGNPFDPEVLCHLLGAPTTFVLSYLSSPFPLIACW